MRRALLRAGSGLIVLAGAALLVVLGLGFCLWGAYLYLAGVMNPASAMLLIGLLALALALVAIWIGLRLSR